MLVDGVPPQGNAHVFPGLKFDRVPLTCRYSRDFTFYVAYPFAPFLIQPVVLVCRAEARERGAMRLRS